MKSKVADELAPDDGAAAWHLRVVDRSLQDAQRRSIDRGARLIRAAAKVLERTNGESLTVQDVADEAGQSLRTLYQYFASKDDLLLAVFEEAMLTYAHIVRVAIADIDEPLERLAGGIIASARMPALHGKAGVDRGLSHLRLQLGQAEPELVARSQAPVTSLFRELVMEAAPSAPSAAIGIEAATYLLSAVRTAFIISFTLGNEYAAELPDVIDVSCFCMSGLGWDKPRIWHESVNSQLKLSGGDGKSILRRLAKEPVKAR